MWSKLMVGIDLVEHVLGGVATSVDYDLRA